MKIHYTGRKAEIPDVQKRKIETKFGKRQNPWQEARS